MMKLFAAYAAGFLVIATPAVATPSGDLTAVLADHWAWTLKQNPTLASELGVRTHDGKLGELSPESFDRAASDMRGFVSRLEKIPPDALTPAERLNRQVLLRDLTNGVDGMAFGEKYILFTNRGGWHSGFSSLPYSMPFFSKADYESYIGRLNAYPRYNAEGIATTKLAVKGGYTQYCRSMQGFEKTINAQVVDKVADSVFMRPFDKKPATISEADFAALKSQAAAAITQKVIPAYAAFYTYYTKEVAPKCRKTPGISVLKDGPAYYQFRIREQTTTAKTADEIHALGLSEVARIKAEMDDVVKAAKFNGNRKAYVRYLRQDAKFAAPSADALVSTNAAFMKHVDGLLPKLFGKLPRLPYTVLAMQDDVAEGNTTAYYEPGAAEAGRAGVYRVNTTKLPERYLFEIPALGMHESVPGHHLQIALQQELDLPNFRRYTTFFTAFVEGWGLYSERLGLDMGVYDTPEKNFGRLSYEMWRACRLVVDTGLHAKGWSRQQAIDFMVDNTALSQTNIEAEVDRYISWPGQALAYKIGELKIRELRARAEKALGDTFDIRAFHDAVLENGAVPLDVLEVHIDAWIGARAKG
jgi:uncharacterized protein (DUF885 family)